MKNNFIALLMFGQMALAPFTLAEAAHGGAVPTLGDWANYLRAQGEYTKLLSEAQLNYSRSQLIKAETAKELQKVRQLKALVNRLELQLRRLARDEFQIRQNIENIEKRSISANSLLAGFVNPHSLAAMAYLQIRAVPADVTLKAMTIPVGREVTDDFIASASRSAGHSQRLWSPGTRMVSHPDKVLPDFTGENVGQMITYLRRHNLSVEPWSPTHQLIVEAYTVMAAEASARVQVLRDEMGKVALASDPFKLTSPFPSQSPAL